MKFCKFQQSRSEETALPGEHGTLVSLHVKTSLQGDFAGQAWDV
jgi:hypothetical protein